MALSPVAHGLLSGVIYALALTAGFHGDVLGPDTCVPVGAIVLLAIASPRDLWEAFRHYTQRDPP